MREEIQAYNNSLEPNYRAICEQLATVIDQELIDADNKIWHAHPVCF